MHAEARINHGGNSGVFFRAAFQRPPPGYEAQINSTHADINKTGSLYVTGAGCPVSIRESPVPAGQWFDMDILAVGNRITIKVNGQVTADWTDAKKRFGSGHIVLQQHNANTVVEFRKIEIKELPADAQWGK